MIEASLSKAYFDSLVADAFPQHSTASRFHGILRVLHDIPFTWVLVSDDSRSGDAVTFRQYEFLDIHQVPAQIDQISLARWATSAPSVLEVLLGCARRWHFYYGDHSVSYFFEHMFRGMGFEQYPGHTLDHAQQDHIRMVVDRWLSRQFLPNGVGSPWPLSGAGCEDQRRVDMWGQMNAYSFEHFQ